MNEDQIIDIARIKLPLAVQALSEANLEVQKAKPNIKTLAALLMDDRVDGYMDVWELVNSYERYNKVIEKSKK